MGHKYQFKNNGFRIIKKPLSSIVISVSFIMAIVFVGMLISCEYDFLQALSVLIMIPAVVLIMLVFFSGYFMYIYFTFTLDGEMIHIKKRFQNYEIPLNQLTSIRVSMTDRQQNYIQFRTKDQVITLLLVGSGGRFMYAEFIQVINELKKRL